MPATLYDLPLREHQIAQFLRDIAIAARRALLLSITLLPFFSGCAVATATVAVGAAAVSVASTAVGFAGDVVVGTVKGAAKVTGAVIDAATGPDGAAEPKAGGASSSQDPAQSPTP